MQRSGSNLRRLLRQKLILCLAFVFAVSGLNVYGAAPLLAGTGVCAPSVKAGTNESCPHCTSGGTEECACDQGGAPSSQMSVCNCGETGNTAPLPVNLPPRVDSGKDLHLAASAVTNIGIFTLLIVASKPTSVPVFEDRPIYLWNCILRT